jgi:hypothetical protein
MKIHFTLIFSVLLISVWALPAEHADFVSQYAKWDNGPSKDQDFFPITVWLQPPQKAPRYKAAGFNTFIGLWKGPTEVQLRQLSAAGMKVICAQNEVALEHLEDPTIIGWMHGDEPDNAQSLGKDKGYDPPILPDKIVADYQAIRQRDSSRPVLLNLGQGVAFDKWIGRGVRTNHSEDYPLYIKGSDIVSFDIYPVVHRNPEVAGKLWYVAHGVERLRGWSDDKKIVWNCIECTRINSDIAKPTPHQVRCEVWMSLIHGSTGLIYFVHEWKPRFNESALLSDLEMLGAVTRINFQIQQLAPVLNSPTLTERVKVTSSNPDIPIATMAKSYQDSLYIFAVAMRAGQTKGKFTIQNCPKADSVEVLDERRLLPLTNGIFTDDFKPWDVHLYRINNLTEGKNNTSTQIQDE